MGVSEKLHAMDNGAAVDAAEKWVLSAGISLRNSLKPVFTKPAERADADDDFPTTPTYAESRIPTRLCPPAPKKQKAAPSRSCNYGGVREFFNPPDLETIFIRRVDC